MKFFQKFQTATVKKTSSAHPQEESLLKLSSSERRQEPTTSTVVEEMNVTEIEYRNDVDNNEDNIFDIAYSNCTAALKGKQEEFHNSNEGAFDFVCTNIESICGFEEGDKIQEGTTESTSSSSRKTAKKGSSKSKKSSSSSKKKSYSRSSNKNHSTTLFKIVKSSPKEKPGVSFIELNNTIYIGNVKDNSKFDYTGLESGMKLVSINGIFPDSVEEATKLLKRRQKTIEIVAEDKDEDVVLGEEEEEEEEYDNRDEDIRVDKRTMLV